MPGSAGIVRQLGPAVVMLVVSVPLSAGRVGGQPVSEHRVKAELIERFTRFVDWPRARGPSPGEAFVLCVFRGGPIVAPLAAIARSRRIKHHRGQVRTIDALTEVDGCHVLYVPARHQAHIPRVVAHTEGKGILTVGEGDRCADDGLMIGLVRRGRRWRFELNEAAARDGGIVLRAKLLRLGELVGTR